MLYILRLDHKSPASGGTSDRLTDVLKKVIPGREFKRIKSVSDFLLMAMTGEIKEVLFAVSIPENGYAPEWYDLIGSLMVRPNLLIGVKAGIIVDGAGPLFTKSLARRIIFAANYSGCTFPGRPLVEATGNLSNFNTVASVKGVDNYTAYVECAKELLDRIEEFEIDRRSGNKATHNADGITDGIVDAAFGISDNELENASLNGETKKKKVLAIHAGSRETSNTLMLLDMVKRNFGSNVEYREVSIRNGEIIDCRGCGFDTCKHFGESGECFYGGVMVEQVYPAILECDALILVCPNYNDSVGANMMAMFNRLTALFYNNSFKDKEIYALIVSGYSGGELLAEQIIGAMNCNKGFMLPGNFALLETANDPGAVLEVPGIEERARAFAEKISDAGACKKIVTDISVL